MNFDTIVNAIKEFFNQPVPIIGITIGSLLAFVLTILSKTTIGKRSLNNLKKLYNELVESFTQYKKESDKIVDELTSYYQDREDKLQSQYNALLKFTIAIASNINNVKVKEELANFEKEIDLSDKNYQGYVESKIEEAKIDITKQYELQLANYETQLNYYKGEFDELLVQYNAKLLSVEQDFNDEDLEIHLPDEGEEIYSEGLVVENGEEE